MTTPTTPAPAVHVVVNGRTYDRNARGRWSYQPANGHKRTSVDPRSRLHHALNLIVMMRIEAELATPRRLALLRAGQDLANTVYNVRQMGAHSLLDEPTRQTMKEACDAWDAIR